MSSIEKLENALRYDVVYSYDTFISWGVSFAKRHNMVDDMIDYIKSENPVSDDVIIWASRKIGFDC